MRFSVLGPVGVFQGGAEVALAGRKQRTVLAALLLARGGVVSDDRLSTLLWGWDPPATRSAQIYTYVSRLRRRLGPEIRLVRRAPGYLLDIGDTSFDLAEFERMVGEGDEALTSGRFERAAGRLRAALGMWRGPALAHVTRFLAEVELPRLEEARLTALESRVEADLALGRHHGLAAELVRLVAEHPARERFRAQLMLALYRCDRQSDALRVYEEGRRLLADELGLDPGPALTSAHREVLTGAPAPHATASRRTATRRTATRRTATPANALAAVRARAGEFPDGQLYVDLGGAERRPKDPYEVLGFFLRSLSAEGEAVPDGLDERVMLYRHRTAERRLLVLLDNAAGEAQVRPLLPAGPHCRAIILPGWTANGACWDGLAAGA
jgi:DNA-binding SARP family transcriptional activator